MVANPYTFVHLFSTGVAAVQLDIVDTPLSECIGVGLEMAKDAWVTTASFGAKVFVNSKLQPYVVDLIGSKMLKKFTKTPSMMNVIYKETNEMIRG